MPSTSHVFTLIFLTTLLPIVLSSNFQQCLADVNAGKFGEVGGTDNHGNPVKSSQATALTYDLCVSACGAEQEPFDWSVFSQQFASWLLPWLSLLSQLPFGAHDKLKNFESVILALGSPTLAAYSLALTVFNGYWIRRRFRKYDWPSISHVVKVLTYLQHAPIVVDGGGGLLSSLVVVPQNDAWWKDLASHLNYTHTWSISAATSIIWVVIAYLFTVVDSVGGGNITASVNANGQGVGDLWMWLLSVVIGWLQLSPKSDSKKLRAAFDKANEIAYVVDYEGNVVKASSRSRRRAISMRQETSDRLQQDEHCTIPIYNYARFIPWLRGVEEIASAFDTASERAKNRLAVSGKEWIESPVDAEITPINRVGTLYDIERYCTPLFQRWKGKSIWDKQTILRMSCAAVFALFLQWGTTGSAIMVVFLTPTISLGCRSASYIVYGVLSTIVWLLLCASSILTDHIMDNSSAAEKQHFTTRPSVLRAIAIYLRRLGKLIAYINSIWVIMCCVFQFSNFYDRCYCNSSIFGLGKNAYAVIQFTQADISKMRIAWIGGAILGGGSAMIFTLLLWSMMDTRSHDE